MFNMNMDSIKSTCCHTCRRPLGVLLVCVLASGAAAAPSFRADKVYPNLGLRLRALGNSEPEPLAPCAVHTYTYTRGDESVKRDKFSPRELWYATQHVGQWRDEAGNLLILGRPNRLYPPFPDNVPHVLREEFDAAVADPATAFDPSSADSLTAWVKAFADCNPKPPEPLRLQAFNLTSAVFFPVAEPSLLVYAFRVKIRKPNGQAVPSDWFCAVVRIADGTSTAKVRKDFETQFLANVAAAPQASAAGAAGVQTKALLVDPKAKAAAIPDNPSRIAARKSVENMKDWWYAETPEYIFLSNIRSATGKNLVRELQVAMPTLRAAFAKVIPPFETSSDVSVVRIFEDQAAYKQYVGHDIEWSIGCWSPSRRELVILSQGRNSEQTMSIIRHEGFHQYLFYASDQIGNATWFNEGHAVFFESSKLDSKGRVEIGEDARVGHLLDNLDAATALLPRLIKDDRDAFYNCDKEQRQLNYTTAWALVYFLRKGAPAEKLTAYETILEIYRKTLAATHDADAATAAAFEGVDMAKFQHAFAEFWKKGRGSARRFDPLGGK